MKTNKAFKTYFSTKYSAVASDENEPIPAHQKTSPPRTSFLLFMATVICSTFLFFFANYCTETLQLHAELPVPSWYSQHFNRTSENYTIKTIGCSIPLMTPYDDSVKKFSYPVGEKVKNKLECANRTRPLLKNNKTHIWIVNENKAAYDIKDNNYSCCYQQFYRPNFVNDVWSSRVDDRIKYAECINFTQSIEVKHEFVKVTCYSRKIKVYNNYFIFAQKKEIMLYEDDKEIQKNKSAYNVIILGIDSVSRLNFHRTMPKTLKYLQSKDAVELLGYTKVGLNSYPNIIPMLTGYESQYELPRICYPHSRATFDFCPFLWTQYKRAGYYTALAEDSAYIGTFNYLAGGFIRTPTDYYMHPFIYEADDHDATHTCFREKYKFDVLLEYVENIIQTVSSSKLFGFFWEVTMSHIDMNYPQLMDISYINFFKGLEKSHYLDNTFMFLVSDHGIRWGPIRSTKQGRLEERLPIVFVLAPLSFQKNYSVAFNNLKHNVKHLTSPYDLHETLKDLIDLKNLENSNIQLRSQENYAVNRGISLFLQIPTNRTCKMAGIGEDWCTCIKSNQISKSTKEAVEAAGHLVKQINNILSEHTQCSKLQLDKVIEANELIAGTPDKNEEGWREFFVVIQTEPGGGLFESTLRFENKHWSLVGIASRINLYGNQSRCVHNPQLKLYCYCIS